MEIKQYKAKVSKAVATPMMEMIAEFGAEDYKPRHVRKCARLINRYLSALGRMKDPSDEAIMEQVKTLVLALNDLNESVDYALIETEEREAIWEIIQSAAVDCGLKNAADDITEEWRDW